MPSPLQGKRVVLGVTGSIACFKAVDMASKLTQAGASVDVVLTRGAANFLTPLTFGSITHGPVVTDVYDPQSELSMDHIAMAERADVIIVAPATANTIAKLAWGFADDALTTHRAGVPRARHRRTRNGRPHVRERRHPRERRQAARARHGHGRPRERTHGVRAGWARAHGGAGRDNRARQDSAWAERRSRGTQDSGKRGRHRRAARSVARNRQPLIRQDGVRHSRGRAGQGRGRPSSCPRQPPCPTRWACVSSMSAPRSRCETQCWPSAWTPTPS